MASFQLIFVLTLLSLFSILCKGETVELTEESLSKIKNDVWLVEYYSPKCSFCKRLAPIWDKVVETEGETLAKSRFFFGRVDCVANKKACETNNIDGYPTILLYNQGEFIEEYADEKNYDQLSKYAKSKAIEYRPADLEIEERATTIPKIPLDKNTVNPDGIVIPLSPTNFSTTVSHGLWYVKFYAPWCGHCQALAPIWVQVAEALRGKVNVAELNCDAYRELCSSEEIGGYPTIKLFQEGSATLNNGERTLDALTGFVLGLTGSDVGKVTESNVQDIIKNDVSFVYVYDEASPKAYLDSLYSTSGQLGLQSKLHVTKDKTLAKSLNITEIPSLAVFKSGEHKFYTDKLDDVDLLLKWMVEEKSPIFTELNAKTAEDVLNTPAYVVLGILNPGGPDFEKQKKVLMEAATIRYHQVGNSKKPRVVFAWIDGHKWVSYVYRVFGLTTNAFPSVVILKTWDDTYFDVDANGAVLKLSSTQILEAVQSVQDHKLQGKSTSGIIARTLKRGGRGISLIAGHIWRSPFIAIGMFFGIIGGIIYMIFQCTSDSDEESQPDKAD
ncbi:hypothetical protein K7432_006588 [Basidiobolus ranarum]|uniref:Thioredoxin domain-containing protein n=1 Tax=Basidiobolus ranarum TaxID=34480 RepID=A0ABR2WUY4_9FUNG